MLVLSRKQDQEIHVPEYGIKLRVLGVDGKRVRIGVEAPRDVRVIRSELEAEPKCESKFDAATSDCFDPDYVWPLGVRYVPGRAIEFSKNRVRSQLARHLEAAGSTAANSPNRDVLLSH